MTSQDNQTPEHSVMAMGLTDQEPEYVYYHAGGVRGSRPILRGASAKKTFESIPVIDVSDIWSDNIEDRKEVATKINDACRNVGFFYAENHNIADDLIEKTFESAKNFFALPLEDKMEAHLHNNRAYRGYDPIYETKFEGIGKGDMKEGFLMAEDPYDPMQECPFAPPPNEPHNLWPAAYPEFRIQLHKYFNQLKTFSRKLTQIFALALELPEDFFDKYTKFPMAGIRCLHYPAQGKKDGRDIGLGAHTDVSFFTLVQQDNVAALQVLNANGIWVNAPPRPRTYVVNVGDYLEYLTNGGFKSTVHRVLNQSGQERFSIPFFFSADRSATIAVLPTCREDGEKYEPVNAGTYFLERLKRSRWQHPDNEGRAAPHVLDEAVGDNTIAA